MNENSIPSIRPAEASGVLVEPGESVLLSAGVGALAVDDAVEVRTGIPPVHFDALGTPEEVECTLAMFEDDKLLARALDGPIHGRDGFDHWILEDELELMGGEDGMRHVSSTLLVHGEDTGVYKTRGLLLDSGSEGVEVEHIAAKDSSSSVDNSGALLAAPADFETLGELAAFAHQTHAKDMNEVNLGTLRDVALRGLFARDNPASRLDALSMQRHVAGLNRGELPMFIYSEGSLRPWSNPGEEEIGQLIEQLPSASNRARYRAELASPASIEAPLAV